MTFPNDAAVEVTLKRGQTYVLGRRKFEFDVPQIVDGKTADYLQEHAVQDVKVDGGGGKVSRDKLQKFEMKVLDGENDDPDPDEGAEEATAPTPAPAPKKTTTRKTTPRKATTPRKPRQTRANKDKTS